MLTRSLLVATIVVSSHLAHADSEAEVRALVTRWVEVQNERDFGAYQALYAPRFMGVRRSGPRVVRLDRASWLKDRRRMFGKPMRVEADAVVVHVGPVAAQVQLIQRFEQGNYRDEGRKALLLVKDTAGWHIAREEMETSDRVAPVTPSNRAWLDDGVGLVLAEGEEVEGWAAPGDARLIRDATGRFLTHRPADLNKVPDELRALVGSAVEVIDHQGKSCVTKLGALRVSRGDTPYFAEVDAWRKDKASDAQIIEQILERNGYDKTRLVALTSCKGAVFARSPGGPTVAVGHSLASGAEHQAALAAEARLPEYRKLQKDYSAAERDPSEALRKDWPLSRIVVAFDVTVGGKPERWISVGSTAFSDCHEWMGSLWSLFRVRGGPARMKLERLPLPESYREPTMAVDLDGEGHPELIYERTSEDPRLDGGILWQAGTPDAHSQEVRTSYSDCPC